MNTDPNANARAAFERLIQEFASASSDDAPILHQRLYGLPDQQLTKRTWEHFRLAVNPAYARKKHGEWQEWVPHTDGTVCSLFVGSGDKAALDRFRRLADTGMALVRNAAANPEATWHFDTSLADQIGSEPTDNAFLNWLDALHQTAKQCRTIFLHATIGNWSYSPKPGETVEQIASAMSEPTPAGLVALPIHPITESLQHDVFRSSAEAIKVWLGMDDVVRVGDWPERPPIYLPPTGRDDGSVSAAATKTVEQQPDVNEMEENILTAIGDKSMTGEMLAPAAGYPNNSNFRKTLGSLVRRGLLGNERGRGYFRIKLP